MADPTSVALERPATTHGRARVAALLLAMGKPLADKVLKYFDENEIREIAETTATLGSVSRASVDKLVNEISIALEDGADIRGSSSEAQQLLAGIVPPEKLALLMTSLQKSDDKAVWTRLADIPEPTIAQYLLKEHAQVAAVILVRAGTSVAAAVLRHAPAQTRSELVRRILAIRPTTEKAEQLLESALRDELLARAAQGSPPPVHARLADIINKMDPQQMDEVLSDLESRRPKDAKLIKGMLFTFDDITKLSAADRVKIFDGVPVERTIAALHGSGPELREVVLACVSARSRRMIEQELSSGAAPNGRDVVKARRAIADLVLDMAERGLVDIAKEASEDTPL